MVSDTDTAGPRQGTATWYLKIDDDSVFGPVENDTLCLWAQQGRVAPGNRISSDQETWLPAEELESLNMCWTVELLDGSTFGPVNLRALDDLIHNGTVSPDTSLIHTKTGETSTPREKRDDIFFGGSYPPGFGDAATATETTETPDATELGDSMGRVARKLADQIAGENDGQALSQQSLYEKIVEFEGSLKRTMALLRAHQRELEEERTENESIRGELTQRTNEVEAARSELTILREQLAKEESLRSSIENNATSATSELARVRQRTEELELNLSEQQTVFQTATEQHRTREAELNKSIDQARATRDAASADAERLKSELAQTAGELDALKTSLSEATKRQRSESEQVQALRDELSALREDLEKSTRNHETARAEADAAADTTAKAEQRATALERELDTSKEQVATLAAESTEREKELLGEVAELRSAVNAAAGSLDDLKVDLRKAQEGALDAQKLRTSLDQEHVRIKELQKQNDALRARLQAGQAQVADQFANANQKMEELQRTMEEIEVITPELVRDDGNLEDVSSKLGDLAELEAQAQRELRAWQRSRKS